MRQFYFVERINHELTKNASEANLPQPFAVEDQMANRLITISSIGLLLYVPAVSQNPLLAPANTTPPHEHGMPITSSIPEPRSLLVLSHPRPHRPERPTSEAQLWKAANAGDSTAQVEAGFQLLEKSPHIVNAENAFRWFQRAAADGSPAGMNNLAVLYFQGRGTNEDPMAGMHWATRAAEANFAPAEMNLGYAHYFGWGAPADHNEAFRWFLKAARHGFGVAQFAVADMYERADGVTKDDREAAKWYSKAIEKNDARALNNLGLLYEFGEGVSPDPLKALNLYTRALNMGLLQAGTNLARLLITGSGIPCDIPRACTLLKMTHGDTAQDTTAVCGLRSCGRQAPE